MYPPHKYLLPSGDHLDLSCQVPSRLSLSPPSLHSKQQGEEGCRSNSRSHPPRACHGHTPLALCKLSASSARAAREPRVAGDLRTTDIHASSLSSALAAASEPRVAGKLYAAEIHIAGELRIGNLRGIELRVGSSSTSMSLDSTKQQENVALKVHVTGVCFKRLRCLIGML